MIRKRCKYVMDLKNTSRYFSDNIYLFLIYVPVKSVLMLGAGELY